MSCPRIGTKSVLPNITNSCSHGCSPLKSVLRHFLHVVWANLPPETAVCQYCCSAHASVGIFACVFVSCYPCIARMATCKDGADIDDTLTNEEELDKALCVLAGSDPENCSYSRVRCIAPPAAIHSPFRFWLREVPQFVVEYCVSTASWHTQFLSRDIQKRGTDCRIFALKCPFTAAFLTEKQNNLSQPCKYCCIYHNILCLLLQGYVKRQAVFACNTCTPSAAEHAGICLACANKCHDGHDIFELYTKRFVVRVLLCVLAVI